MLSVAYRRMKIRKEDIHGENKLSTNDRIKGLCTKVAKKCKKKPYLMGLIFAVVVLVFIPAIIWLCYFLGDNGVCLIQTSLTVGDALGFYGTVLSFIGTTALGVIAVWQNKRLQHLEEVSQIKESSCSIYIRKFDPDGPSLRRLSNDEEDEETDEQFVFCIQNYSDAFLTEIEMACSEHIFCSKVTLAKGEAKNYYVLLPKGWDEETTTIDFTFTSCYGIKTYGDVVLEVLDVYEIELKYYHFYGTIKKLTH